MGVSRRTRRLARARQRVTGESYLVALTGVREAQEARMSSRFQRMVERERREREEFISGERARILERVVRRIEQEILPVLTSLPPRPGGPHEFIAAEDGSVGLCFQRRPGAAKGEFGLGCFVFPVSLEDGQWKVADGAIRSSWPKDRLVEIEGLLAGLLDEEPAPDPELVASLTRVAGEGTAKVVSASYDPAQGDVEVPAGARTVWIDNPHPEIVGTRIEVTWTTRTDGASSPIVHLVGDWPAAVRSEGALENHRFFANGIQVLGTHFRCDAVVKLTWGF